MAQTKILDLESWLSRFAPPHSAEAWDAVGLQVGNPADPVRSVLLTLDVTPDAVQMARQVEASLILCHHPPVFHPLTGLRTDNPQQKMLVDLASRGVSVLAAHTNLDQASGGVADCLADLLAAHFPEEARIEPLGLYGRLVTLARPVRWLRLLDLAQRALGAGGCLRNSAGDPLVQRIGVYLAHSAKISFRMQPAPGPRRLSAANASTARGCFWPFTAWTRLLWATMSPSASCSGLWLKNCAKPSPR